MGEITTVGKILLKSSLPADLRQYVDQTTLDAKGISGLFERLADRSPETYKKVVTELTRLGFEVSTRQGSSVGLSDLVSPIDKDKAFAEIDKEIASVRAGPGTKVEKDNKVADAYHNFSEKLNKDIVQEGLKANKTLAKVIQSGSRGSPTQYRQTVAAPVLVNDSKGRPMIDFPIKSSFAEGLSLPEYLAHSYGTRVGTISTKLNVADAGFLNKQTTRANMTIKVEEHDCGTDNGLEVRVNDRDSIGSCLAHPTSDYHKNNEVTVKMLKDLDNKKVSFIVVRSPITCQSSKKYHSGAVCQLCVGKRERGGFPPIGDYVGLTASTTLGERLAQGALNVKHRSASAQKTESASGFKLINQLANIPDTFRGKAALSFHDGVITSIDKAPQGGHYVYVGTEQHYVPTGFEVIVHKGQHVEAGDQLSEGIVNPAEIVKYKGIGEGRKSFTDSMYKAFKDSGMTINRRNFELISKGAIDHVKITSPDGLGDYLPDQIVSYHAIAKNYKARPTSKTVRTDQAYNQYLEEPILHYTIGTRITNRVIASLHKHKIQSLVVNENPPPFEPEMQRLLDVPAHESDWMHQLYSTYLEKRFLNAVNTGAKSNLSGPSPIPGIAYGIGFGQKKNIPKHAFYVEYDEDNDMDLEKDAAKEFGCLMAVLKPHDAKRIVQWSQENIKPEYLADKGIEHASHVTVLFGLHPQFDPRDPKFHNILKKYKDGVHLTLKHVSRFENKQKGYDIIKLHVDSHHLKEINKELKEAFPDVITNTHPTYNPHLTLAYVKPGAAKHLDEHAVFLDDTHVLDELTYSFPKSKYKVRVGLSDQPVLKKAEDEDPWAVYDSGLDPSSFETYKQLKEGYSMDELSIMKLVLAEEPSQEN